MMCCAAKPFRVSNQNEQSGNLVSRGSPVLNEAWSANAFVEARHFSARFHHLCLGF